MKRAGARGPFLFENYVLFFVMAMACAGRLAAQSASLEVLQSISGPLDGTNPSAPVIQGSDGNFYGTTPNGGINNAGTVYKMTPAGVLTTLYTFTGGADGETPMAGLTQGSDGNFYGTTSGGNGNGDGNGTVFKITPAGVLSTLYAFTGGADGASPEAGLIQGSDGNFYGTTEGGGNSNGNGTVFRITSAGVLTTLDTFTGGTDGASPEAGLIQGSDGNFYGTTDGGGNNESGTVFKITPAGVLTTLYTFTGGNDGSNPRAGLTQGSDGNFYGTTAGGGSNGAGAVFKITPAGVLTPLYSFTDGSDGAGPKAGLTQGSDGNFYGTTFGGGSDEGGTVFKITPAGVLTTLHDFTGVTDGDQPEAGLTLGSDGNFYGTTPQGGGASGGGTVFKITPTGVLSALHDFAGDGYGHSPAGLSQGSDGNFYGTTPNGNGSDGDGTVFKVTPAGVLSTLYAFSGGADGASPEAGLTLGSDGNFYGTTARAGANNGNGTVFQVTPAGVLSALYTFSGGAGGASPQASLTLGSDGNFYGTTEGGGDSNGDGTIFQITPAGVLTTLHTFTGGTDGASPVAGLTLGSDGNFYGATTGGGDSHGDGTVFEITPAGVLTTLYTFNGRNGSDPEAGLTLGSDGNFYGTTNGGGQYGSGVVFRLTLAAQVTPPPIPAILLTSPPIDETVVSGSTVPLAASVNDPGGILSQVQFTLNGDPAAPALTAAPFVANVVAPAPGTYVLQATATDTLGRQSTSSHTLTVIAAATDPGAPSAVLLTGLNGRKIGAGDTIVVTCDAVAADGSPIQQVNFYANGTLFASVDGNGNPIALSASPAGSGALIRDAAAASSNALFQAAFQLPVSGSSLSNQYNLLAIAFSKLGTAQTSDTATVTSVPQSVDQPPQIALAGLTSGQHLTTGISYTASTVAAETAALATVAGAPSGSLSAVAKIEYYLNKLELLNATVSGGAVPNFTFTAPAPGEYIVEAIATDSAGVASVADPITVQIDPAPVVTVSALGDGTAVVGGKKAKVLISRTGDTSSELKVSYKLAGTAVDGVDYQLAPDSRKIVIPAGSASVKIRIEPIADPAAADALSAKIKLTAPASGAYTLGSPSRAKITILQH